MRFFRESNQAIIPLVVIFFKKKDHFTGSESIKIQGSINIVSIPGHTPGSNIVLLLTFLLAFIGPRQEPQNDIENCNKVKIMGLKMYF